MDKKFPPTIGLMVFAVTDKKNEKSPDYRVSAKVGEEYVNCGSGWRKNTPKSKFLSLSVDIEVLKKLIAEKEGTEVILPGQYPERSQGFNDIDNF